MLSKIRERATGWLAWVVVILIAIPFALWGVQSYFTAPEFAPVASVNGEEIPLFDYQRALSDRRESIRRERGGVSREQLQSREFRMDVLQSMVINRVITQYVNEQNYRLDDASLRRRIETDAMFLRDGEFDPGLYHGILRSNGMSPQIYEDGVRRDAAVTQLSEALTETAFATETEIDRLLQLRTQVREAKYVIVPASRFAGESAPEESAVAEYYANNEAEFRAEARVKIEYIELSVDALAAAVSPSEEEIAGLYERNIERYTQAESRKASHILLSVDRDADEQTRAEILARAEEVFAQAKSGADFAELAKEHSDDPGSKNKGGDLGPVLRGQMVAPFEEAVFAMSAGEIRGPVETQYGYHIIQLTELQAERRKELSEVRAEVAAEVARERALAQFSELAEQFENLVFESADSLTPAADELGLEVQQSDWFTAASGDGVAAELAVREAAFGDDVLLDGVNSAALELGFERLLALRRAEHEPAHVRALDDVRAEITEKLRDQTAAEKARELGETWLAEIRDGTRDWDAIAREEKWKVETLSARRDQIPPEQAQLGAAIFSHAPPAGAPVYAATAAGNGDYALYALTAAVDGELDAADDAARAELREMLLARDGEGAYRAFLRSIRAAADVSIDERQLQVTTAYQ